MTNAIKRRKSAGAWYFCCVGAGGILLVGAAAHAVTYTYTPTNTDSDLWSSGANWSPGAPVSGPSTQLDFATGATFPAGFVNTNTNDLGAFQLATLNLAGAGSAAAININAAPGSSLNFTNGAIHVIGTGTPAYTINSPIVITGTLTINQPYASPRFDGPISGGGSVTLTGNGFSTSQKTYFSGNNSYAGSTTVSDGRLVIASDAALGSGSGPGNIVLSTIRSFYGQGAITASEDLTINSARGIAIGLNSSSGLGTLDALPGKTLTYNGVITDNGTGADSLLTGSGGGTVVLGGGNLYSGPTVITATTLSISSSENLGTATGAQSIRLFSGRGGALSTASSFTLDADRGISIEYGGNYPSRGRIDVAAGATLTYGGVISQSVSPASNYAGQLIKTGAGTLVLNGPGNTYIGTTQILGGTLAIASEANLGSSAAIQMEIDGGALKPLNSFSLSRDILIGPTPSRPNAQGTATFNVPGGVSFTPGLIHEYSNFAVGNVVKDGDGTLTISGTTIYTGTTTINAGTYVAANATKASGTGNVTINGGTLAGHGRIQARVLAGTGPHTIAPSATLGAGATGTLTLDRLTTGANTTLAFNLVTPGASSVNDRIKVNFSGSLTLNGGAIAVGSVGTDAASLGYYRIVQYAGSIQGGGIESLALPPVSGNIAYTLDTTHDAGFIDLHRGFLGDADDDGAVTFSDFIVLANHFGQPGAGWSEADFDNDHVTTFQDFVILANHFGQGIGETSLVVSSEELAAFRTASAAFVAATGVPEPGTLAVVALASVGLVRRRRGTV